MKNKMQTKNRNQNTQQNKPKQLQRIDSKRLLTIVCVGTLHADRGKRDAARRRRRASTACTLHLVCNRVWCCTTGAAVASARLVVARTMRIANAHTHTSLIGRRHSQIRQRAHVLLDVPRKRALSVFRFSFVSRCVVRLLPTLDQQSL